MTVERAPRTHSVDAGAGRRARELIRVAVTAPDPVTLTGLTEMLAGCAGVFVLPVDRMASVDVLVYAEELMTSESVAGLRRVAAGSSVPTLVVTHEVDQSSLLSMVECHVVAILHRGVATAERLERAVRMVANGDASLPADLLGELLRQVNALQCDVLAPRGLTSVGLTSREIDVLRLVADGCDTEEIGERLCYSERTVKSIIRAMTGRLNVRNRPQLVAYGFRAGIL